jgi:hypothetical protein
MRTINFIASPVLLLIFAIAVAAQNAEAVANWRILNVPELGISIDVPADFSFALNMYERDPGSDQKKSRGEFQSDDERFFLFVDSANKNEQYKMVMNFVGKNIDSDKKKDLLKSTSGKTEFMDPDGYYHCVRFFKTRSKTITMQTVSTVKDSKPAVRFLNSFTFFPEDDISPAVTEAAVSQPDGSGMSTGDIGRSNTNAASDTKKETVTPVKIDKIPLRLVSKPRAQYTDLARFYNIQGVVRLRVTFGSDSKIGAINVVKKLPFGLVDESIKAARKMKFKPKEQDGKPVTIVKPLEYSFTIY